MTELICMTFLVGFLLFYSALFFLLLGGGIRGAVQGRLKRTRVVTMPEDFHEFAFSPQTQRNRKGTLRNLDSSQPSRPIAV
jgi:hypothetical protein